MTVLIDNLKTAWTTNISMPLLSSLDNFLYHTYIIFQEGVENFEIDHETCSFLVRELFPLKKERLNSLTFVSNG